MHVERGRCCSVISEVRDAVRCVHDTSRSFSATHFFVGRSSESSELPDLSFRLLAEDIESFFITEALEEIRFCFDSCLSKCLSAVCIFLLRHYRSRCSLKHADGRKY
jgi:hypothetical protein